MIHIKTTNPVISNEDIKKLQSKLITNLQLKEIQAILTEDGWKKLSNNQYNKVGINGKGANCISFRYSEKYGYSYTLT